MGYTKHFSLELLPRNLITLLFTKSDIKRQCEDKSFLSITKTQKQSFILEAISMLGKSLL